MNGSSNPNWKGGISLFKTADQLLTLKERVQDTVKARILSLASSTTPEECWNWKGPTFHNGRAKLTLGKNNHIAARLMYILVHKKPLGDLHALHKCDNPRCVNPEHLFCGTSRDNTQDMFSKGRAVLHPGSRNGMAILDEEKVSEIKDLLRRGYTQKSLARVYKVSTSAINLIATGKTWRHVV